MEILILVWFILVVGILASQFGADSRPSEHERPTNW